MLQPVGSLAPVVYWRRRAITLVGLLSVLALLGWGALSVADSVANSASTDGDQLAAAVTSTAAPITAPPATSSAQIAEPAVPAAEAEPSADAPQSSIAPAPPAVACTDKAIKVVAAASKASYKVGATPILVLTVINQGKVDCIRDLDSAKQELLIYNGKTRLWSSNDCYPEKSTDVRTLKPGEMAQFTVEWSGLSSAPGCTGDRPRVEAGIYTLRAKQGAVLSADAKITLTV